MNNFKGSSTHKPAKPIIAPTLKAVDKDRASSAKPATVTLAPAAPPVAARASEQSADTMSRQQHSSIPSVDEIKGKWKQQVGSAKIVWGKLTDDEILRSEGHEEKLAGLVEQRYAITREEAKKQVRGFLDKHKHN